MERNQALGQALDCFLDESESYKEWNETKPWAIKSLQVMGISPQAPHAFVGPNHQLSFDYLTHYNFSDNPKVIDAFLEIKCDPIFVKEATANLLHYAARANRPKVMKRALELFKQEKVTVDGKDENGKTAFFDGITTELGEDIYSLKEIIDELLEAGADPLSTEGNGMTCLHYAIAKGYHVSFL